MIAEISFQVNTLHKIAMVDIFNFFLGNFTPIKDNTKILLVIIIKIGEVVWK